MIFSSKTSTLFILVKLVNVTVSIFFLITVFSNTVSKSVNVYVVVNFLFQLIFIFPLFWGMVMYANEFKTKEKQKLTEIKN